MWKDIQSNMLIVKDPDKGGKGGVLKEMTAAAQEVTEQAQEDKKDQGKGWKLAHVFNSE